MVYTYIYIYVYTETGKMSSGLPKSTSNTTHTSGKTWRICLRCTENIPNLDIFEIPLSLNNISTPVCLFTLLFIRTGLKNVKLVGGFNPSEKY